MFLNSRWSVTWPTRPVGVYTVLVRAVDPTDAVRVAAELDMPLAEGYSLAWDYEPEVWRLLRPYRYRSHLVAGPDFGGVDAVAPFAPTPVDLDAVADEVVSVIRIGDRSGETQEVVHLGVQQILMGLTPRELFTVVARVAAETAEINRFTRGAV